MGINCCTKKKLYELLSWDEGDTCHPPILTPGPLRRVTDPTQPQGSKDLENHKETTSTATEPLLWARRTAPQRINSSPTRSWGQYEDRWRGCLRKEEITSLILRNSTYWDASFDQWLLLLSKWQDSKKKKKKQVLLLRLPEQNKSYHKQIQDHNTDQ